MLKADWVGSVIEYDKVYSINTSEGGGTERLSMAFVKERNIVLFELYMGIPAHNIETQDILVAPYTYNKTQNVFIFGDNDEYAIPGENKITINIGDLNDIELELSSQTAANLFTTVFLPMSVVETDINLKNGI